ncbi:hypothetical protein ACFOWX_00185 [Sphingorhabdus arenilitoris]|uniref:Uncharacterized protein n=1 Tax=Sphingorhabdus arenilitoris TaxID=1490041 RepID=A0ABV8RBY6_9SPHN
MSIITEMTRAAVSTGVRSKSRGKGLIAFGVGLAAARIATRSLPGAALVGGALLAKAIYDRRKEKNISGE